MLPASPAGKVWTLTERRLLRVVAGVSSSAGLSDVTSGGDNRVTSQEVEADQLWGDWVVNEFINYFK